MKTDIIFGMGTHTYIARIKPAEEGGYVAYFPSLPGCHTQGESFTEVIEMAKDVLALYLSVLKDDGSPMPREKLHLKRKSQIDIPLSVKVS